MLQVHNDQGIVPAAATQPAPSHDYGQLLRGGCCVVAAHPGHLKLGHVLQFRLLALTFVFVGFGLAFPCYRPFGQAAAYRERYRIADTIETLLPDGQRGEQARAHAWAQRFLHENPMPAEQSPVESPLGQRLAARTTRLREQLSALADQLASGPAGTPQAGRAEPGPAVPIEPEYLDADPGPEPN